jgi:hypothetical protein
MYGFFVNPLEKVNVRSQTNIDKYHLVLDADTNQNLQLNVLGFE